MSRILIVLFLSLFSVSAYAADAGLQADAEARVEQLDEPLYSPFVERYVLDELKALRTDMAAQRAEFIQMAVDRELSAVDKAVTYATNTVTYFFYLIAAASSVLVLVGWSSIREIKERVHTLADQEINSLVAEYEQRLHAIEQQLSRETRHIEENREKIERTQEVQSLWLRAGQEINPASKIAVYDQIISVCSLDVEALTYKADAVLELGEPQWASNLCHQALEVDPDNGHAFYQLACAYTAMNQLDEAVHFLLEAVNRSETYWEQSKTDTALAALMSHPGLETIKQPQQEG
jgi:tetratricopeptide (TPR) repeat protein